MSADIQQTGRSPRGPSDHAGGAAPKRREDRARQHQERPGAGSECVEASPLSEPRLGEPARGIPAGAQAMTAARSIPG
jgi:hypothetical protein